MSEIIGQSNNENEWINWLEEAIKKEHIKYYKYNQFNNIKKIGSGGFGKVYRANWINTEKVLALKAFEYENMAVKEIIRELNLQRKVDFHENIIRFLGITEACNKYDDSQNKKYMMVMVMEFADGGSLQNYLKRNYDLTWENKYQLAYQIALALECLHNEGIVHRDLNSNNVLVHQHKIKLADFGLSRRIEETSKAISKLFGVIPYIDPNGFGNKSNIEDLSQNYKLNEKSDIYSLGVLFWELSSGKPPFKNMNYDLYLALKIVQGLRETVVEGTSLEYVRLYTECWDGKPNKRPTIQQIVVKLRAIMLQENVITEDDIQNHDHIEKSEEYKIISNSNIVNTSVDNSLQGGISELVQNLDSMDLAGFTYSTKSTGIGIDKNNSLQENISQSVIKNNDIGNSSSTTISNEKDLNNMQLKVFVDEIIALIVEKSLKGLDITEIYPFIKDFITDNNKNPEEFRQSLEKNQINSDFIFLLGYFNFSGIGFNDHQNYDVAFKLFLTAAEKNHIFANYYVGICYEFGKGVTKDEKLAFIYYQKAAKKEFTSAQLKLGYFYEIGLGVEKNEQIAFETYEKVADNGNVIAKNNLGLCYYDGRGVKQDYYKAFELFQLAAEEEYYFSINMLGKCYFYGNGININKEKGFELYQKAANLGYKEAQKEVARCYQNGIGTTQDLNQAIYWYEKFAEQ